MSNWTDTHKAMERLKKAFEELTAVHEDLMSDAATELSACNDAYMRMYGNSQLLAEKIAWNLNNECPTIVPPSSKTTVYDVVLNAIHEYTYTRDNES